MKYIATTLLLALCFNGLIKAQSLPMTIVEEYKFQDVFIQENSIVYATDDKIVEINEENEKVILADHPWSLTFASSFYPQEDDWVYIGWPIYSDEVLYPGFVFKASNEEDIKEVFGISPTLPDGVTYQSDDKIYVLYFIENGDNIEHKMNIVDIEGNILETLDIDVDVSLLSMILLEDDLNLLVGLNNLYTFSDKVENEIAIDFQIFDVKLREDGLIEAMTEEGIYLLDKNLALVSKISIDNEGTFPTNFALKSSGDKTYILERNLDNDFITILNPAGETISEFQEIENVFYRDLKAKHNKVAIWGKTNCARATNILKLDNGDANSPIATNDIELTEFSLELTDFEIDTIFTGNNMIIFETKTVAWEIEVTNLGNSDISSYYIRSNDFFAIDEINIDIEELEPLSSGESRSYTGEFTISNNIDDIEVWVTSDAVDIDCDNNIETAEIPTSAKEVAKESTVTIYPNPTANRLYLKDSENHRYSIYDKTGKLVLKGVYNSGNGIGVEGLSNDMYIIKIGNRDTQQISKFIKI